MRRTITLLSVLFVIGCSEPVTRFPSPPSSSSESLSSIAGSEPSSSAAASEHVFSVPGSVQIDVPFSSQAPFAEWDALHEEACEEMALIMVVKYWKNEPLSQQQAEAELQQLVSWMTERGYGYDVTMEQLADVAEEYYGMHARVETDVSVDSIKQHLSQGQPVIIPAAGRDLGNPYFSGEGPWYHALTITGYQGNNFITNDPGTRRGENYKYNAEHLVDVIHDWTGTKEDIRSGAKRILIVNPS